MYSCHMAGATSSLSKLRLLMTLFLPGPAQAPVNFDLNLLFLGSAFSVQAFPLDVSGFFQSSGISMLIIKISFSLDPGDTFNHFPSFLN